MTAIAMPPVPVATAPSVGVTYAASRQPDGKWSVIGVPIFGTVEPGRNGVKSGVDAEWLAAALESAKTDEAERGYLPPLHIGHGEGEEWTGCGFVRLTHVAPMLYEGEAMPVLFGDLVGLDDGIIRDLANGRFPYRSAESVIGERRILSVALLNRSAPFMRFPPMTGVSGVDLDRQEYAERAGRVLASSVARTSDRASLCFAWGDAAKFAEAMMPEEETPAAEATDATKTDAPVEAQTASGADKDAAPSGPSMDDVMKVMANVAEMCAAILKATTGAATGNQTATADVQPVDDDEEETTKMSATNATTQSTETADAKFATLMRENAELSGRLSALEGELKKAKADAKFAAELETAKAKLSAARIVPSDSFAADYRRAFDAGVGDVFLGAMTQSQRVPPATFADAFSGGSAAPEPEEVAKFAAKGPRMLEAARSAHAQYEQLMTTPAFRSRGITLASFLASHEALK